MPRQACQASPSCVLPHRAASCLAPPRLPFRTLSRPTTPVQACLAMPSWAAPSQATPYLTLPAMPCPALSCLTRSCPALPALSCLIVPCRALPRRACRSNAVSLRPLPNPFLHLAHCREYFRQFLQVPILLLEPTHLGQCIGQQLLAQFRISHHLRGHSVAAGRLPI